MENELVTARIERIRATLGELTHLVRPEAKTADPARITNAMTRLENDLAYLFSLPAAARPAQDVFIGILAGLDTLEAALGRGRESGKETVARLMQQIKAQKSYGGGRK